MKKEFCHEDRCPGACELRCTGRSHACKVFSPASVDVPTTENSQRVEARATGEPADDGKQEQNCP